MAEANHAEVIVKKIKKGGHGGHHGGAWKVAYADFVTAMMAFFLLLWLLNATTEEQRLGISNYFAPGATSKEASGAGGVLGGLSPNEPGPMSSTSPVHVTLPLPPIPAQVNAPSADQDDTNTNRSADDDAAQSGRADPTKDLARDLKTDSVNDPAKLTDQQKKRIAEKEQERAFDEAEKELRQAIQSVPQLQALKDSLIIDRTPEGMRIQIVDQDKLEMFPLGSANMYDYTKALLGKVAEVVKLTSNKIAISGHTDARPYARGNYTNWELSVDRANASRRALIEAGLPPERIARVTGNADTDLLIPTDPLSPRNRRISITLLQDRQG